MEREIVSSLSDEALFAALTELCFLARHFEAAERSWSQERAERERCKSDLYLVHNECMKRGIKVEG